MPIFLACALGMIATIPLQFLSLEHLKLEKKFGKEKGAKIGEILGIISGWSFFLFLIGIWIAPQPKFRIPVLYDIIVKIPIAELSIPLFHLILGFPLLLIGGWLGISGVKELSLSVSETHRPTRVIKTGVYSHVRHPQYLGGLLAHIGITLILSAFYSLLYTPILMFIVYLIARKEEMELIKEFGDEYEEYRRRVPMFIPRIRKRKFTKNLPHENYP